MNEQEPGDRALTFGLREAIIAAVVVVAVAVAVAVANL